MEKHPRKARTPLIGRARQEIPYYDDLAISNSAKKYFDISGISPIPNNNSSIKTDARESVELEKNTSQELSNEEKPLSQAVLMRPEEITRDAFVPTKISTVNFFFNKALRFREKGNFTQAIKFYQKILSYDNNHLETLVNLGVCLLNSGLITESIQQFDKARNLNPKNYIPYFNKAIALIYIRCYPEAVQCLDSLFKEVPDLPQHILKLRALALYRSGRVSAAINYEMKYSKEDFCKSYNTEQPKKTSASKLEIIAKSEESYRPVNQFSCEVGTTKQFWQTFRKVEEFNSLRFSSNSRDSTFATRKKYSTPAKSIRRFPSTTKKTTCPSEVKVSKNFYSFSVQKQRPKPEKKHQKKHSFDLPEELPAFVQSNVSKTKKSQNPFKSNIENSKLTEKLEKLKKKIDSVHIKSTNEIEQSDLKSKNLTELEIHTIKEEFQKPYYERNYNSLSKIVKKLQFFEKFSDEMKINLLKMGSLLSCLKDDVVFSQGDTGSMMYVIFQGSVSVMKTSDAFSNKNIYVNSLYDGDQFGLATLASNLGNNSNERNCTAIANEDSTLFALPKSEYREIIITHLKQDIDGTIKFITKLPFFKGIDPVYLIPLASKIKSTKYEYKDVVLEKGQFPQGLYIVKNGYLTAYTEGYTLKSKYANQFGNAKLRKPEPKPFITGKVELPKYGPYENTKPTEDSGEEDSVVLEKASEFIPQEQLNSISKDQKLFKEKIEFKMIQKGQYFGGRALLSGDTYYNTETNKTETFEIEPTKFTVVAETAEVEVFCIKKEDIANLNEKVISQLKTVLKRGYEIDAPSDIDSKLMDKFFVDWIKFKEGLVEGIRRNNFAERKKGDNILLR